MTFILPAATASPFMEESVDLGSPFMEESVDFCSTAELESVDSRTAAPLDGPLKILLQLLDHSR